MMIYRVIKYSLQQALLSALFSALLGSILAWLLHHAPNSYLKKLFRESLSLFFTLPTLVLVPSLIQISQHLGFQRFSGMWAIVICHTFLNAPLMARSLLQDYDRIPNNYWRQSMHLGMNPLLRLQSIEIPLLTKTFLSKLGIIFILCFSSFSIPLMLTQNAALSSLSLGLYYELVTEFSPKGALPYLVPLLVSLALKKYLTKQRHKERLKVSSHLYSECSSVCFKNFKVKILLTIILTTYALVLWGPFILSFHHIFGNNIVSLIFAQKTQKAILNSTLIALIISILSTGLSLAIAALPSSRISVLSGILSSLLLLPSFIISVILYIALGPYLDLKPLFSVLIIHILLPLPFSIYLLRNYLQKIKFQSTRVCQTLRLTTKQSLLFIYIPQLSPALWRSFSLSASLSLGNIGAIALLGDNLITLPSLILTSLGLFDLKKSLCLSMILLSLTFIFHFPVILSEYYERRISKQIKL